MNRAEILDFQRTYYPLIRKVLQEVKTMRYLITSRFGKLELLDVHICDIQLPDVPQPYPDAWFGRKTLVDVYLEIDGEEFALSYHQSMRLDPPVYFWKNPESRNQKPPEEILPGHVITKIAPRYTLTTYPVFGGTAQMHKFFIDLKDFESYTE